jgi:hypothetical protein
MYINPSSCPKGTPCEFHRVAPTVGTSVWKGLVNVVNIGILPIFHRISPSIVGGTDAFITNYPVGLSALTTVTTKAMIKKVINLFIRFRF